MSRFLQFCLRFLILDFIWQVITIQAVNSLKISVEKDYIEFQTKDYFEHLEILTYTNKGMKKYSEAPALKKQATEVCGLRKAQLFTLCQWIANSETYKNSRFELTREQRFLPLCYPQYVKFGNENKNRLLEMVTCPYIKRRNLNPPLKENELLSFRPGTLFVSGSAVANSVLVFISRRRAKKIICDTYGYVTDIDMAALKKITNFEKAVEKALKLNAEFDNYNPSAEDSQEFVDLDLAERPLYFKDLL